MDLLSLAGPLVGGGSSLLGSYLGYLSAREANQSNKTIARWQMDFQERMSNTAFQRGVKDLEAAGLNPILATGVGGASSPVGSAIPMQQEFTPEQGLATAKQLQMLSEEIKNMKENRELTKAQKRKINKEIEIIKPRSSASKVYDDMIKEASKIYYKNKNVVKGVIGGFNKKAWKK